MTTREKIYRFIFKVYIACRDWFDNRFFVNLGRLFRLPHPKMYYDYRVREFLKWLTPSDRVADLACGTGKLARTIRSQNIYALGIDVKTPLNYNPTDFEFFKMDILNPGIDPVLRKHEINTIALSHILEHIEDSVGFLKRFGGFEKILICVPSQENWRHQFKKSLGLDSRLDHTHFREYTLDMLKEETEQAGLQLIDSHYTSEGEIFGVARPRNESGPAFDKL
jgi:SAM-dependent methyltransferase